jgi:hypothetical protein
VTADAAIGRAGAALALVIDDGQTRYAQPASTILLAGRSFRVVRQADVIFTMTAAHREALVAQFPGVGGRVSVLAPDRQDVIDPIGGSLDTYRACARQIHRHLAARLDTIAEEFPGA